MFKATWKGTFEKNPNRTMEAVGVFYAQDLNEIAKEIYNFVFDLEKKGWKITFNSITDIQKQ